MTDEERIEQDALALAQLIYDIYTDKQERSNEFNVNQ
jgi:hypothetical protein